MEANATLGVSLSVCRTGLGTKGVPLYQQIQDIIGTKELVMPVPAFNVINGVVTVEIILPCQSL